MQGQQRSSMRGEEDTFTQGLENPYAGPLWKHSKRRFPCRTIGIRTRRLSRIAFKARSAVQFCKTTDDEK